MEKGLVKLGNFRRSPVKREYAYLLTAAGLEKRPASPWPLKYKVAEYEALKEEIEQLRSELENRRIQSGAPADVPSGTSLMAVPES